MTDFGQSFRPDRHVGGLSGAMLRLETQAALTWPSESVILERANVAAASSIVELGCGSGALLSRVRDLCPRAEITGVDLDERLIESAIRRAADVRLIRADVRDVPLADACADVVIMRYVLQHLPDPHRALQEAFRLLRPGGRVVVLEVDGGLWGISEPFLPDVERLQAKIWASQSSRGGNRMVGRRLRRWCSEQGFAEATLELYHYSSDDVGVEEFGPLLDPEQHIDLVEDGIITPEELARATVAYGRWLKDPRSYVMMVGFAVTAIKRSVD